MARKTAIRTDNQAERLAEYRGDALKDATPAPETAIDRTGLHRAPEVGRIERGQLEPHEFLKLAMSAARLELRGAMFSADDRQDVAATVMLAVLEETGGALPRADSPRVALGRLCGDVKNARRSIERRRARWETEAAELAAVQALAPDALGADASPAKHVAIVQRSGAKLAERAALSIMAELNLPADVDSAAFTVLYVWTRGLSPEQCAAERGVSFGAWRVRQTRGAKFIREFYGAAELTSKLTLGASTGADGTVTYVLEDRSRSAHSRTRMLADLKDAPHWRERGAETEVTKSKLSAAERVHWRKRRAHRTDTLEATGAALTALARAHAQTARGAERSAARTSAVRPSDVKVA